MQLTVKINLDNDEAADLGGHAVATYLRRLAGQVEDLGSLGGAGGTIRDGNGALIGQWMVGEADE